MKIVETKERQVRELRSLILPKLRGLAKPSGTFRVEGSVYEDHWPLYYRPKGLRWRLLDPFMLQGIVGPIRLEPPNLDIYCNDDSRECAEAFADLFESAVREGIDFGSIKHARLLLR